MVCKVCGYLTLPQDKHIEIIASYLNVGSKTVFKKGKGRVDRDGIINFDKTY